MPLKPEKLSESPDGGLEDVYVAGPTSRAQLVQASHILADACQPARESDAFAALAWLASITAAREGEEMVDEAGLRAMAMTLSEYPADVALFAVREWPKRQGGKWWPTAADMHGICRVHARWRQRLKAKIDASIDTSPRTHQRRSSPYDKTLEFYQHVARTYGEKFAYSWLNDENCDFTDDTIFTTGIGLDRLSKTCDGIAEKYGVRLIECPDVRKRFQARVK